VKFLFVQCDVERQVFDVDIDRNLVRTRKDVSFTVSTQRKRLVVSQCILVQIVRCIVILVVSSTVSWFHCWFLVFQDCFSLFSLFVGGFRK
jgi:hypothetical protein